MKARSYGTVEVALYSQQSTRDTQVMFELTEEQQDASNVPEKMVQLELPHDVEFELHEAEMETGLERAATIDTTHSTNSGECSVSNETMDKTSSPAHTSRDIKQGELVVVAYEDDWFISEVTRIVNENEYEISSMTKTGKTFKWPAKKVVDITHRNFILKVIPQLTPSNLRYSQVENINDISSEYLSYCDKYF